MKDLKLLDSVKIQLKNKQSLTKIDEGLQADVQMKKYQIYELPYKDLYYAIVHDQYCNFYQQKTISKYLRRQHLKRKELEKFKPAKKSRVNILQFMFVMTKKNLNGYYMKNLVTIICNNTFNILNQNNILKIIITPLCVQLIYVNQRKILEIVIAMCITLTIFLLKLLKDIMTFYRLDIMVQYLCNYLYHCDLKTANVLVNSSTLNIKICDLGFANQIQQKINCRRGSRGYFAPEFFQDDVISLNEKTEVFALGVILYQLLTNEFPYTNQNNCLKWISITKSNWKDFWKNKRIHQQYKEIIQNIFEMDPNKRCNINYLQNIFHF